MVGYAYSAVSSLGYRHILIKVYDCDDLTFVDDSTPYQAYSVNRETLEMRIMLSPPSLSDVKIRLRHITEILKYILYEELKRNYPVKISWSVTPSGNCIMVRAEDMPCIWPVAPSFIEKEIPYVNITKLCFKHSPSFLEVTFLADVLNESAYLCGIYSSELFKVSGNQIYASLDVASLQYKLFKIKKLYSVLNQAVPMRLLRCKIKLSHVFEKSSSVKFEESIYRWDMAEWAVNIKRDCIEKTLDVISRTLKEGLSFKKFLNLLKISLSRDIRMLLDAGSDFMIKSRCRSSTDMSYLTFDELLMALSFRKEMQIVAINIRTNKTRNSQLKKLTPPLVIYKGKFFY